MEDKYQENVIEFLEWLAEEHDINGLVYKPRDRVLYNGALYSGALMQHINAQKKHSLDG